MLSQEQEDTIQKMIIDTRPEQLKMDFHLWSRAAVSQLIEQEFGIKLQVRSTGKYLTRWGFTPQKPIKRAHEQSPAAQGCLPRKSAMNQKKAIEVAVLLSVSRDQRVCLRRRVAASPASPIPRSAKEAGSGMVGPGGGGAMSSVNP